MQNTLRLIKTVGEIVIDRLSDCQDNLALKYLRSVRSIYGANQSGRPYHIGSGVLIEYRDKKYLLTAAHVIDHNDNKSTLYIAGPQRLELLIGSSIITQKPNGDRLEDKLDFCVLSLSGKTLSKLNGLYFIPQSEWITRDLPDSLCMGLALGYPNSKNKRYNGRRKNIKWQPFVYSSTIKRDALLYRQTATSPDVHYLLDYSSKYSKDSRGKRVSSTSARGVSGGGLFWMPGFRNPENYAPNSPCVGKLIGILIEKPRSNNVLIYTRLSVIIAALKETNV